MRVYVCTRTHSRTTARIVCARARCPTDLGTHPAPSQPSAPQSYSVAVHPSHTHTRTHRRMRVCQLLKTPSGYDGWWIRVQQRREARRVLRQRWQCGLLRRHGPAYAAPLAWLPVPCRVLLAARLRPMPQGISRLFQRPGCSLPAAQDEMHPSEAAAAVGGRPSTRTRARACIRAYVREGVRADGSQVRAHRVVCLRMETQCAHALTIHIVNIFGSRTHTHVCACEHEHACVCVRARARLEAVSSLFDHWSNRLWLGRTRCLILV